MSPSMILRSVLLVTALEKATIAILELVHKLLSILLWIFRFLKAKITNHVHQLPANMLPGMMGY